MVRNKSPEKSVKLKQILNFLSFRARSEQEVRDRLTKYGLSPDEIEAEIEKLKRWKLIDDEEFAKLYIESRSRLRPRSRRLLQLELKRKGVILEPSTYNLATDFDLAQQALTKKKNVKSRDQAIRFLQSRGFSWETIEKVLKLENVS